MIKRKIIFSLSIFSSTILLVSCVKEVGDLSLNGQIYINENILKTNQNIDYVFTIPQLNMLFNKVNFFQNKNKEPVLFQGSRIDQNGNIIIKINDYEYSLHNLNKLKKYNYNNETKTFTSEENFLNYDDLFNEYSLIETKEKNFLKNIEEKFIYPKNLFIQTYPDIAWILNSIIKNLNDNYYKNLLGNFIKFNNIRPEQWFKNLEQIKYIEWLMKLYLKYFNTKNNTNLIEHIKILSFENINNNDYAITFDFLDKNEKSLLNEKSRKTKFYISNFRRGLSSPDLRTTIARIPISEPEIMFSEYLNNAALKFTENFYSYRDFDDLIVTATNNQRFTAKAFKYFINKYFNKFIKIEVPLFKQNEDLEYEIINLNNIEYNDIALNAKNVLKVLVRVHKKNGTFQDYPWYSFDFNSHQHLFKGYHIDNHLNLNSVENLWSWSNENYFNIHDPFDVPKLNKGIDPNAFFEKNMLDLLNVESYRYSKTLLPEFNKIKSNIEVNEIEYNKSYLEYLETFLNIDILSFLIGNQENQFETGIDSVKVSYHGYSRNIAGTILLTIDFLDKNKKSILSKHNSSKIIEFGGFKGFDFTQINKQEKIFNTENKSINYFFENKINQLPKIAKWSI